MNSGKNAGSPGKSVNSSPWWDKMVMQAISLANDAAHSPVGRKVMEQVDQVVDEAKPQVEKIVKTYTNEISNPYQFGMGLEITRLDDQLVEAVMPHRWRNRNAAGSMHNSAFSALAEFASNAFWKKRLVNYNPKLALVEIQGKFFEQSYRRIRATMEVPGESTEEKISLLQSQGSVLLPCTVAMRKKGDVKVAEFTLVWKAEMEIPVRQANAEIVN